MQLKKYKTAIMIIFFVSSNYAAAAGGSFSTTTQTSTTKSATTTSTTTTNNNPNQTSVSDNAKQIANSNQQGSQIFAIASAGLTAAGTACVSTCGSSNACCARGFVLLGMGVLAGMQSSANGQTAGGAWDMYNDSFCPGCDGTDPTRKTGTGKFGGNPDIGKLQGDGIHGVKLSKDGKSLIDAKGNKHDLKNFSSPGAMAAAGIPKATIDEAMAVAAKIEKDAVEKIGAHTAANGFAEGGGGGGSANAQQEDPLAGMYGEGGLKKEAYKRDVAGQNVAGLTKNFNGEPIGVSADDIFVMMNRRYKVKEQQDNFFREGEFIKK